MSQHQEKEPPKEPLPTLKFRLYCSKGHDNGTVTVQDAQEYNSALRTVIRANFNKPCKAVRGCPGQINKAELTE